jgi:hypothetical protein
VVAVGVSLVRFGSVSRGANELSARVGENRALCHSHLARILPYLASPIRVGRFGGMCRKNNSSTSVVCRSEPIGRKHHKCHRKSERIHPSCDAGQRKRSRDPLPGIRVYFQEVKRTRCLSPLLYQTTHKLPTVPGRRNMTR